MNKTVFYAGKVLIMALCLQMCSEDAVPGKKLRREISNKNPLFIYNIYLNEKSPEELKSFHRILPEDVSPYFGIQIVKGVDDSPDKRAGIEKTLDAAEEKGMPVFVQIEHYQELLRNDFPDDYWDGLFEKYEMMTGLSFAEISVTNFHQKGLDEDYMERMARAIEMAASWDGYFLWQDMGYDDYMYGDGQSTPQVFVQAGANEELYGIMKKHSENIIIQYKHNGWGKRFSCPGAVMGLWTSGAIGNWGVNSEDWLWWEAGYGPLYQAPSGSPQDFNAWEAVFTYPESMFGIEWLYSLAGGATVFSLETSYHGLAFFGATELAPAFRQVLLPLIRLMTGEKIIPSKKQVMEKINAAYQPLEILAPELDLDVLYTGLYGAEESILYEWIPSTGRYYYVPIIPLLAGDDVRDKYHFVFNGDYYQSDMDTIEKKKAVFDGLYPSTGDGDSWFVNINGIWMGLNPNENRDIATTFDFPMEYANFSNLSGSIAPHTFFVVREKDGALMAHLSNYRIDSDTDVWGNEYLLAGDPAGYLANVHYSDPSDDILRQSVLTFECGTMPEVEVSGDNGFTYDEASEGTALTLTVMHNGPVDISLRP